MIRNWRRTQPHARWILPLVVVVGAFVLWRESRAVRWREIAPGVEFATLRGEPYCRRGSSGIAALRLDPERVRLRVHHYSSLGAARPFDIVEWQRRTTAVAVFNAGQFYPDWRYMGLLASGGRWVSPRAHKGYQALLVADRTDGGGGAAVLDLAHAPFDRDSLHWNEVAQSFMLFDSTATLRVRRSERIANRTVVGEDRHHRIVVLVSEGAYTLADFAHVIMQSPLEITHAMSMDGGREAELLVARGGFRYASFGPWPEARPGQDPPASNRTPLPAVIAVELP
ncbi:MAG: hypothetical protein RL721_1949 [Candidatus Eisenbacteria bacterium]